MTSAASSATRSHEADATALGRSYAALARQRRRQAHRRRPRRPHPFARARGRADRRADRGRARRRPHRPGPLADALFRGRRRSTSTAASRSPAATIRPITTASRCCSTAARCSAPRSRTSAAAPPKADWSEGAGEVSEADVIERLCRRAGQGLRRQGYRIGWDAGNGAGGPVLEKLVKRLPGRASHLYTEVDGTFPNHHPDPTVEANLADLKALVADKKPRLRHRLRRRRRPHRRGRWRGPRDLGRPVADDPRRARCSKDLPGATIIADVKASQTLFDRIAEMGGTPLMWKTGHSLIKSKMKETGAPLAGEMSGHIFFKHHWYGFDDALYAAVRLIRAVSQQRQDADRAARAKCRSRSPPPSFASRSTKAASSRWSSEVADRLAADGAEVDTTDGVRVKTADGWWLLRASNTQDVLVARAEAQRPGRARPADGDDQRPAGSERDRRGRRPAH